MAFTTKFLGDGPNAMITRVKELKKTEKGARAVLTLLADLEGDGVAGDRQLEGNEEAMKTFDTVIRLDQLRNANRHEGRMADQKSVVEFRGNSRDVLAYWLSDRIDQLAFLTLSGQAYSLKNNGATRVGSAFPDLEFAADVSAPTTLRRLRWDEAGATSALVSSAATSDVAANDTPSWKMIVDLKAYAKDHYIRGIKEGGEETYHLFMTPRGVAWLKKDADYLNALRYAQPRGDSNPLFTGAIAKVDGIYIHEFRHVFNTTGTATKWGAGNTIEGQQALFCGAQALGMADIGLPNWVEKGFDYENQQGISVAKIFGMLKPKYTSQYDGSTVQDFGVISCYTAI